jgi:hypothetical protein
MKILCHSDWSSPILSPLNSSSVIIFLSIQKPTSMHLNYPYGFNNNHLYIYDEFPKFWKVLGARQ